MCTYLTATAAMTGSGKSGDGWFPLADAVVYFDHPQHAMAEHALCIDFRNARSPSDRIAVELTADAARELAATILSVLDAPEAQQITS